MSNYFITGGTGTLGRETTRQLLKRDDTGEIIIFSRDELKQKQMKSDFDHNPKIHFVIGDIKDIHSLIDAMNRRIDYVFHFAALKHIDVCEENPSECLKTNVHGTQNIARVVFAKNIKKFIFSSTDKAINPINIYGMSKLMAEKMVRKMVVNDPLIFRWGNVLGSRGSFLDIVKKSIMNDNVIPVASTATDEVTRFFVLIEDAVEFMISCKDYYNVDDCLVPPMKGATIERLINLTAKILGKTYETKHYDLPSIEKTHEEIRFASYKDIVNSKGVDQYTDEELTAMIKRCL